MKAAVRTRYGPPEIVQFSDVPKPEPKDDEVLVKVHATTVNRTDCAYRSGTPYLVRILMGLPRPRAKILGCEFAGVVDALGKAVMEFNVGDRVFGYNEGRFGGHGEYLAIAASGPIVTMPAAMAFADAAPSFEGSHYALTIINGARITGGQAVLVFGATGAIGSATVQLLKGMDVTVTAVCATSNVELVKGLGADRVVDYTTTDFTKDDQTYDAVFDCVGKTTFGRCKRLLKPRGTYISTDLGPGSQNLFLALATPLLRGKRVRFPIPKANRGVLTYLKNLMESGDFKPVIDQTYSFDDIVEAYRYVETGQKVGNVVITVVSDVGDDGAVDARAR